MLSIDAEKVKLLLLDGLIWPIALITYLIFLVLRPAGMLKWSTLEHIIYSSVPIAMITFAEAIALLNGNFDLSVGQQTGFIAMISAVIVTTYSIPPAGSVFIPLLIGALTGSINGVLVGYVRLNPFLATLGTYMVFSGGTLIVSSSAIFKGFPEIYLAIGDSKVFSLTILIVMIVLLVFMLERTRFGLHLLSTGDNYDTAKMMGIRVNRIVFSTFVIGGLLCGIAALIYTGFTSAVSTTMADNTLFLAFAGAVIGGISLEGGRGSMLNAYGGALMLSIVQAGLIMFRVSSFARQVLYGVIVILAILINRFSENMRDRILMPAEG